MGPTYSWGPYFLRWKARATRPRPRLLKQEMLRDRRQEHADYEVRTTTAALLHFSLVFNVFNVA